MMKNILNVKKNFFKPIFMSSIIFVNAVTSMSIAISTTTYASNEDNSYTPWGWEELYNQSQKDRDKDWGEYLACGSQSPEFNVFTYDPDKSPDSCTPEELVEIAKEQRNYWAYRINDCRDRNVESIHNQADEKLAKLGVPKDHPKYGEALEILKPYIKENYTDPINSKHKENIEMVTECCNETIDYIKNGTPFSREDYKESWENHLDFLREKTSSQC